MSKCKHCGGHGYVAIGPGIRGIKECPVCNGTGKINKKKLNFPIHR